MHTSCPEPPHTEPAAHTPLVCVGAAQHGCDVVAVPPFAVHAGVWHTPLVCVGAEQHGCVVVAVPPFAVHVGAAWHVPVHAVPCFTHVSCPLLLPFVHPVCPFVLQSTGV